MPIDLDTFARYRALADALPPSDVPMPAARDAAVGYLGTTEAGRVATFRCMACCDLHPLKPDRGDKAPARYYGEDHRRFDSILARWQERGYDADWYTGEACDLCRVSVLDLSMRCQAEHDAQQARWDRQATGYPLLVEYGVTSNPRCRVY